MFTLVKPIVSNCVIFWNKVKVKLLYLAPSFKTLFYRISLCAWWLNRIVWSYDLWSYNIFIFLSLVSCCFCHKTFLNTIFFQILAQKSFWKLISSDLIYSCYILWLLNNLTLDCHQSIFKVCIGKLFVWVNAIVFHPKINSSKGIFLRDF